MMNGSRKNYAKLHLASTLLSECERVCPKMQINKQSIQRVLRGAKSAN